MAAPPVSFRLRAMLLWPVAWLAGCFTVLSLCLLVAALIFPPDEVHCGYKRMTADEVCIGGGTYEEMAEQENRGHLNQLVFGTVGFTVGGLIAGAAVFLLRVRADAEFGGDSLRGVWLEEKGRFEAAERWHRGAVENGRTDSLIDLGRLLERRGDVEGAEAAYLGASQAGVEGAAAKLARLRSDRRDPTC
ncbi:hypothetical protein FB566_0087 [Stackebrandtia endophytica]|uniref:Tetratricopeptide repeat protein n=1 Tax=Stackebrandtia endophytica TaxID=1496996 RepID=A0A543APT4_9ACTN|nr:hypothetical protein [Stackebrandtia endophytica]TQL74601.1 hypothetical protein FB566_0087 [Stackebrandtia endophytica]